MSKFYKKMTDALFTETLKTLIETKEEFNDFKQTEPKILMVSVTNMTKDEEEIRAFDSLPYIVKINNIKDRVISSYALVFYFDNLYIESCNTEREVEALIYSALNQIEFSVNKDGDYVVEDDGVAKMKLNKPDFILTGYESIIRKYGIDSPEMKLYNRMLNENAEAFNSVSNNIMEVEE